MDNIVPAQSQQERSHCYFEKADRYEVSNYGASCHGVSEALYLDDPDKKGVELYRDKPKEQWPADAAGNLLMVTEALNLEALLGELT